MTWRPHPEDDRFLGVLEAIDLPGRYWGFVDAHVDRGPPPSEARADWEAAIGVGARWFAREKFYRLEHAEGAIAFRAHLSFHPGHPASRWGRALASSLEGGFYASGAAGDLGGTLHGLALDVAKRRDPGFDRTPPYPRLPYSTLEEMRTAVAFALDLFARLRTAVCQHGPW